MMFPAQGGRSYRELIIQLPWDCQENLHKSADRGWQQGPVAIIMRNLRVEQDILPPDGVVPPSDGLEEKVA